MPEKPPPYALHPVTAEKTENPTAHVKRVTIDASHLPALWPSLPAQWLKVFVPRPDGTRSGGRAYTIRRFDPLTGRLEIDFVLHGDSGEISAWAARAEAGARFEVSAPHPRSGFAIDPATRHYLLLGDETALPAIAAILEAMPPEAEATAILDIASAAEEQPLSSRARLTLIWLHRDGPSPRTLTDALWERGLTPGTIVWAAAESAEIAAIRHAIKLRGLPRAEFTAAGYWKRGEADHLDHEAAAA